MFNNDNQKRGQGKSRGVTPQRKNQTSFGSDYQPSKASYEKAKETRKKNQLAKTQAQEAMEVAGHDPMMALIGIVQQYEYMLGERVDWFGEALTPKQHLDFVKEYTRMNENLTTYYSSKAPTQLLKADPIEPAKKKAELTDIDEAPLTAKDLVNAKKAAQKRLDDRI
jgi:hypothetical protein